MELGPLMLTTTLVQLHAETKALISRIVIGYTEIQSDISLYPCANKRKRKRAFLFSFCQHQVCLKIGDAEMH